MSVCDEGHNILVPELGYPFFDQLAPSFGIEVRKYALLSDQNWQIDLEDVSSKLDLKTKFLFVINPSNPTGFAFLKHLISLAPSSQGSISNKLSNLLTKTVFSSS
jgi:tyrosine aminotransferase